MIASRFPVARPSMSPLPCSRAAARRRLLACLLLFAWTAPLAAHEGHDEAAAAAAPARPRVAVHSELY